MSPLLRSRHTTSATVSQRSCGTSGATLRPAVSDGPPPVARRAKGGGAGGIRTLDRALQPYNGLANRRLQPLGHSSVKADMPDAGACRKRQIPGCRIPSLLTTPGLLIEALKPILEAEAGTSGLPMRYARVANAL